MTGMTYSVIPNNHYLVQQKYAMVEIFKLKPKKEFRDGTIAKYIKVNRYGYCMMIIKATDGLIPNNYKGVYRIHTNTRPFSIIRPSFINSNRRPL